MSSTSVCGALGIYEGGGQEVLNLLDPVFYLY